MSADNYVLIRKEDRNNIMVGGHYWTGYVTSASTDIGSKSFYADSLEEAISKAQNMNTEYGYRVEGIDEYTT